ncbi:MAG: DNA polymerase I [Ignavibacteriaceae bacterium]|nr:DNA polymerase I [Ignavibacteriaceae bacterium]
MPKKFVIIDAMALAYKAYFAFISRPLSTAKGEPTSAVFGFVTQLARILEETKPDYLAVAFDSKEKTFRHEEFENYKSSRAAMPDDMIPQIGRIKEIIEAMNIPLYILPRFEADDLIGTAVREAKELGLDSYVITPDKDMNQLVNSKVKVLKPGKSSDEFVVFDEAKVKEEFGFEPKQMIDYLALVGDSSDDIPGVAGIGPKTATPLIQKYGSIENLYKHIDEIEKESLRNKLLQNKDNAFLSKRLATINCEVPIQFDFEQAKLTPPNFDKLKPLCLELEFKTFFAKVSAFFSTEKQKQESELKSQDKAQVEEGFFGNLQNFDPKKVKYELIQNLKSSESLADKLSKAELFVFDTETNSLNQFQLKLVGASFSAKANEGYFVAVNPFEESEELFTNNLSDRLPLKDFIKIFKPVFENKKIKKVCQNGKFDISVMKSIGINVNNFYFDTMLASYCIDPDQKHGMDDLSQKYLGYKPIPFSSLVDVKKDPNKIFEVELNVLSNYSCEDADITFRLYEILGKEIEKENLNELAYKVEFPLVEVLHEMERTGVKIDTNALSNLSKDLQILIDNYTTEIYKVSGTEFNINSPKQLQEVLFKKLGLESGKKTKTGFSTDARSLENLRGEHEVIDLILDYRQVSKLKSTYTDSLPTLIEPSTGRIHTDYNQTVASTGRLSSINPNLQNIPIRTERGKEIRKAFIPTDKNHVILSADYSQIELRILASLSGDEELIKAFKHNEDIHRSTAAQVFMVHPKDVTQDMRRKAKEVNFGILYGIGPFGLKTRLGITQTAAKDIIEKYFSTYKRVKNFMDESIAFAKENGYAETLLKRRRFLRNINSKNHVVRQFEERVAINMPIQGTAADMIKIAMINIHHELKKKKYKTKMVLQVHDELVFDAHKDEIEDVTAMVKKLMENALPLKVPVHVDTGVGNNWLDAH